MLSYVSFDFGILKSQKSFVFIPISIPIHVMLSAPETNSNDFALRSIFGEATFKPASPIESQMNLIHTRLPPCTQHSLASTTGDLYYWRNIFYIINVPTSLVARVSAQYPDLSIPLLDLIHFICTVSSHD